jgi:hypothetical protein
MVVILGYTLREVSVYIGENHHLNHLMTLMNPHLNILLTLKKNQSQFRAVSEDHHSKCTKDLK